MNRRPRAAPPFTLQSPRSPIGVCMGGLRGSPLAVVLGDLELVQALGRAGVRSVAVGPADSKVRHSRYVVAGVDAPTPGELEPDDGALVERLLAFAAAQPQPPIVYCDSDEA